MYLFDTDTITNILKPKPSKKLLNKLKSVSKHGQYISTITLQEIVYGAYKSRRKEYHLNKLRELLLPSVHLAGFDARAAYVCGALKAEPESAGTPLCLADLQIAAIALANNFILITGNTRHFSRIKDLKLENWL